MGFVLLIIAVLAGLFWLGWGRSGSWEEATGWDRLTEPELGWKLASEAEFLASGDMPKLQWMGHATLRVEWGDTVVVTDPVYAKRIKVAPRRFNQPMLDPQAACDLILLSHAHMDHMDNASLERMASTRIMLPAGSEGFLSAAVRAKHQIVPLELGETYVVGSLKIVMVPAVHGGWRYPWQKGYFAAGYILEHADERLYLAGDTAMGTHFESIAANYAPRYAVLPIGAYSPEFFLRSRHLNPEEALQAAELLGAEYVIPYHFGTYRLSLEAMDAPLGRFAKAALAERQKWFLPVD